MTTAKQRAYQRRIELAMRKIERPFGKSIAHEKNRYVASFIADFKQGGNREAALAQEHTYRIGGILGHYYKVIIPIFGKDTLKVFYTKSCQCALEQKQSSNGIYDIALRKWVLINGFSQAKKIAKTSTDDILKILRKYADEPVTDGQITDEIQKVTTLSAYRAATIARTETHNATQFAVNQVGQFIQDTLQVEVQKSWISAEDERTREAHAAMDAEDYIPLSESFIVGGEEMDRPGDPGASPENVINCRCVMGQKEAGLQL